MSEVEDWLGPGGRNYAEIYGLARKLFGLASLENMELRSVPGRSVLHFDSGIDEHGTPYIMMGRGRIPASIRYQLIRQQKLPPGSSELPNKILRTVFVAHHLGHIMQEDADFVDVFGNVIDGKSCIPDGNERIFDLSKPELHATYVATALLGASSLTDLGLLPLPQPPEKWEMWADLRRSH